MPDERSRARWFRLRTGRNRSLDDEVRAEIEEHVAMRVEHLVAQGYTPNAAEREARARFGEFDSAMRRLYASARTREERMERRERINDLRQDIRHAVRLFGRTPLFFAATVFTLALGIGANGAVFGVLRSALLQPLPYRDPSGLFMIWRARASQPAGQPRSVTAVLSRLWMTPENLLAWREQSRPVLGDLAAIYSWQGNLAPQFDLTLQDRAERLRGAFVTPNFFDLLGARAAHGRLFGSPDSTTAEPMIVLSHALWRRAFAGDPRIVGRPLTLTMGRTPREPRTFTVAGVLPPGFHFTYPEETEAWALMPWGFVESFSPRAIAFMAVGRLAPGVTKAQLDARLTTFRTGLEQPGAPPEAQQILRAEPIRDWVVGETRPSLYLLGGVAALLLLITCVTVANALLARVSERQRELALRASLGARRGRLVRQLVTEGAFLALCGTVAGTLLAVALTPVIRSLLPASLPRVSDLTVDVTIIGFGAAMAALTTLLAAVAPALGGTRRDTSSRILRVAASASADRSTVRWRQGLVGVQAAIATTLLICAALLLTSFWRLGNVPLGFDGEKVLTVEMRLLAMKYRQPGALEAFQRELLTRVRAIPGVTEAGITSAVPFRGVDFTIVLERLGEEQGHAANGRFVDPGYFDVLRVPLLAGRLLNDADVTGAPRVMVISQSYARSVFGEENPVGKRMNWDGPVEIVGVVGDVRYESLDLSPRPAVYLSSAQSPRELICVVARTIGPASTIAPAIYRAIREIDPDIPAMQLTTIDRIIDASIAGRRFYTVATAAFAALALVLTTVGLAVVVARVVAERRRELAIRSALGASRAHLVRRAAHDGLAAVGAGVVMGLAGAAAGSVLLAQFLFEVAPRSAAAYGTVAALVMAVAAAAVLLVTRGLDRLPLAAMLRAD